VNRRGFLGSILALGAAPAIVRADSLMRIVAQETTIYVPDSAPLLLVPDMSFVTHAVRGLHSRVEIDLLVQAILRDSLRYGRPTRDVRISTSRAYDPLEGVMVVRAEAHFMREIPQCTFGMEAA
jgi:hypothetical protein